MAERGKWNSYSGSPFLRANRDLIGSAWGETMNEERAREIAIQILGEFEELLAVKGIEVPSENREGRDEEACLCGCEYYELEDAVTETLVEEMGGERCCSMAGVCEGERRDRAVIGSAQR